MSIDFKDIIGIIAVALLKGPKEIRHLYVGRVGCLITCILQAIFRSASTVTRQMWGHL